MKENQIGYLLRAGTSGCVAGCRVSALVQPQLGALVRIPQSDGLQIYGLIYDIHIDDDGLVRQLVTAENIKPEVIEDNRIHRTVPVEISIVFCGYQFNAETFHLLPPRPPLTLDEVFACDDQQVCEFTRRGRFGYFRHILRGTDFPVSELLASHLHQAAAAHRNFGNPAWSNAATQELITLLRDDYPALMNVLGALADARLTGEEN
ncbi:MAG: hypothetical protein CVU39_10590 [Chloroflexi bacterium HGW-Chloroflexi-10]|nr:MAG: hypothetical protein CVU39_10590 [Chloroflexi bacterium HGW-Chloroflexi-10]